MNQKDKSKEHMKIIHVKENNENDKENEDDKMNEKMKNRKQFRKLNIQHLHRKTGSSVPIGRDDSTNNTFSKVIYLRQNLSSLLE